MAVLQSGNITPGHLAVFATTDVIKDGGPLVAAARVLAYYPGANFNDTGDQAIAVPAAVTAFMLTGIVVTNASISLTTAVGGFYPQSGKGGTPIVSAAQVYSSLLFGTSLLQATLASYGTTTRFSAVNVPDAAIYFSLTTAQGAAATADIYIVGLDLSLPV